MSELFQLPESPSPRLQWARRFKTKMRIHVKPSVSVPGDLWIATCHEGRWSGVLAEARSEIEALEQLAQRIGYPLWYQLSRPEPKEEV